MTYVIIERESYITGYTRNGVAFTFDKADYDKVKKHSWYLSKKGYISTKRKGKIVPLRLFSTTPSPSTGWEKLRMEQLQRILILKRRRGRYHSRLLWLLLHTRKQRSTWWIYRVILTSWEKASRE